MFRWIIAAFLTMAAGFSWIGNPIAAEYNLKMQTYYSPTTAVAAKFFADQVEKLTNGKVKVQVFTGGELVDSNNILKSVRNGMIDIGQGMGHHFTERKSGQVESGLPFAWMSPEEADEIYEKRSLRNIVGDEYKKLGVVYLGPVFAAPSNALSKQPIRSLDDMKKMKIRAVGGNAKLLSSLGVNVVNMPVEDIYMGLTTGQVDGVVYGSAGEYKENKWYEAAPWLNVTPFIDPITDTLIINKKVWDKMPKDIRDAIQTAANDTKMAYYNWADEETQKAKREIFKDKMSAFSDADQKKMVQSAEKLWEEQAKKSDDARKGVEILREYAKSKGRL